MAVARRLFQDRPQGNIPQGMVTRSMAKNRRRFRNLGKRLQTARIRKLYDQKLYKGPVNIFLNNTLYCSDEELTIAIGGISKKRITVFPLHYLENLNNTF